MTLTQFRRWQRFTLGLLRGMRATRCRRGRLVEEAQAWFVFLDQRGYWADMISWDESRNDTPCSCDLFHEFFDAFSHWSEERERRQPFNADGRFFSQLSAAVRAGMDCVAEPSAGVLGFTVGDVKRAFDWHIPAWFLALYPSLNPQTARNCEGIWL